MKKILLILFTAITQLTIAQKPSSEIYVDLQKFHSFKKVLYVAAHPDDENTRALAYFSLGEHAATAYLSLTRGDGGQNLIGDELSEDLGVLRTQELLAARSHDHAEQYFSKAVDFGYSKSADETFDKWGKEAILSDVVLMIRQFQPDVIITRFPPDERGGHGHHTASAILAMEAFELAKDKTYEPEQVAEYGVWSAAAVYWNASNWWNKNLDQEAQNNPDYIIRDIGGYNELLGMSYNEIGTIARSQHKCQGFGAIVERGSRVEYFQHLAGTKLKEDFFEKNTKTWSDEVSQSFENKLNYLLEEFDFLQPANNVPTLIELREELLSLPNSTFKSNKVALCNQLILDCLGIYAEIRSDDYAYTNSADGTFNLLLLNRSNTPVTLKSFHGETHNKKLNTNEPLELPITANIEAAISNPYWLNEPFTNIFTVTDKSNYLKAENDPTFLFPIEIEIDKTTIKTHLPANYVWRDPAYGERRRSTIAAPVFTANFSQQSVILKPGQTKNIELKVHSFSQNLSDEISVDVPKNWKINQSSFPINLNEKHEELFINIELTATDKSESGNIILRNKSGEVIRSYVEIAYDHIPTQALFKPAQLSAVKIDAKIKKGKIAYIKGVEDAVPQAIEQLGFEVSVYEVSDLSTLNLNQFQSIVLGIRIYNVHPELGNYEEKLFDYVADGGNLIMQYNTASRSNPDAKFGHVLPFELSRNRVTEEDAAVTFLAPDHPIMNYPNQITQKDFDNWVQERGLYFANNWSDDYTPLFSWHDVNEDPQLGALIVAEHGKGQFVYTGISFFRELPNGVEGAYRLFANLLSYEK